MLSLEPWHVFASVGILLALMEVFTATFFTLPAGLAFLATAVVALFTQNWTILTFVLAVNLTVVYTVFYRWVWPRLRKTASKTNAEAMAGRIATVCTAIDPHTGEGEVKLYGDTWRVISRLPFAVGAKVRIVSTEGNRVVVEETTAEERIGA